MKKRQFISAMSTILIALILLHFGIGHYSLKNKYDENKRILSTKNEIDICHKVDESFNSNYEMLDSQKKNELKYNGNDEKLIDYLKEKNMINSINYLKSFFVSYSIAISVDIILIFVWIYSLSCYCNPRCCCKGEKGCCCKISMYITIAMFFGIFINGVFGIIYWGKLIRNLAEAGCSYNKMFDHFKNGFGEDYANSKEWSGFDGICKTLSDSKDINISELKNKYSSINECKNREIDRNLDDSCSILEKGIDFINKINTFSIEQLEASITLINDFKIGFLEVEKNYKDDLISINNKLINLSQLYLACFILMMIFGALGFFILLTYTQKCQFLQYLFFIFFNIEAIFMIFLILMGIYFGLIDSISRNIVSISVYSTSSENLGSQNPIIFNKSMSNYIDICVNKNSSLR